MAAKKKLEARYIIYLNDDSAWDNIPESSLSREVESFCHDFDCDVDDIVIARQVDFEAKKSLVVTIK